MARQSSEAPLWRGALVIAAVMLAGASRPSAVPGTAEGPGPEADAATQARTRQVYGQLPLSFEVNRGQTDPRVDLLARGPGYTLFLTPLEAVFVLSQAESAAGKASYFKAFSAHPPRALPSAADQMRRSTVLRMILVGADAHAKAATTAELPGKTSYFVGSDATRWRTGVPTYAKATYRDVYPGIDVAYYGNQRELEYDFIVHPGSAPDTVRLRFEGADRVELDASGELLLHTGGGVIRKGKPHIYQVVEGGRREIPGGYVLSETSQVSFEVGGYDHTRALIIDPTLVYSTYLGGSAEDFTSSNAIAIDGSGNAYVTGSTSSANFPTSPAAADGVYDGGHDAFVTKLDASGSAILYSTYLGGTARDFGFAVAVDSSLRASVTGLTFSANFPATPGAFDVTLNGNSDIFVARLNALGTGLEFSTYVGGSGLDQGHSIALDTSGNAYVAGVTNSADFPTTAGAVDTTQNAGSFDAFVAKLSAAGSALAYSTYLGGTNTDAVNSITVDALDDAYVTGYTHSSNFPTTPAAFDTTYNGGLGITTDVFVAKLTAVAFAPLVYSTYVGGSACDVANGIAVDTAGSAYVAGYTCSTNYPTTAGAFDTTFNGGSTDAFVTRLNASGSALAYSTYLGGSDAGFGGVDSEFAYGIAVDAAGAAYVTGFTHSADFPTTAGAFDTSFNGLADAFVTKLNAAGSAPLLYSTYLGGVADDAGSAIALDSSGSAYVTGFTRSATFPTTPGAFDTAFNGDLDSFVAKIAVGGSPALLSVAPATGTYAGTVDLQATLTSGGGPLAGKDVSFTLTRNSVETAVGSATTDVDGVATLNGVNLADVDAGLYPAAVGADFSGDAGYSAANGVADLTVNQASPEIAWTPASPIVYGTPLGSGQLNATASFNGVDVQGTFVYTPGAGTVLPAGEQVLEQTFTPDDATNFIGRITQAALTVTMADQTIDFAALPNKNDVDPDFPVGATATSGLPVTFAASGTCTIAGATVQLTAVGSCTITASQGGDANYNPAPPVAQTFAILDTTPPSIAVVTPTTDTVILTSPVLVQVLAADAVGVTALSINGVAATLLAGGTPQLGTWEASVPVTLPVPVGGAIILTATASDLAGNPAPATLIVDNDGIDAALDTDALTYSDAFTDVGLGGTTSGTIATRAGWTVRVRDVASGGVEVTVTGAGGIAAMATCAAGGAESVELDGVDETATVECVDTTAVNTGSRVAGVNTAAAGATARIIVRNASGKLQAKLRTGDQVTIGSPVTAGAANTEAILVELLDDTDMPFGSFLLDAGESVDVEFVDDPEAHVRVTVLNGTVDVTILGRTRTLTPADEEVVFDLTPPTLSVPADLVVTCSQLTADGRGCAKATDPAVAAWLASASASDALDPTPVLTHDTPAVLPIGVTTVTFRAVDDAANETVRTARVQVVYAFGGFEPPILKDGSASIQQGGQGRTIPVKFTLSCLNGAPVTTAVATIAVFKVLDVATGSVDTTDLTADAGSANDAGNLFRHTGSGQYHYNLSTKGWSAPATYRIVVTLDDGTEHRVDFSLR